MLTIIVAAAVGVAQGSSNPWRRLCILAAEGGSNPAAVPEF